MRRHVERTLAPAVIALVLGACASETVVLLPDEDGHVGALAVRRANETLVLDRPYASAHVRSLDLGAYTSDNDEVMARFGATLAAQPSPPRSFTVYFAEQGDEPVAQSKEMLDDMATAIARFPAPEVLIVGHTDLVGSDEFNDALSRKRAESIRAALVARGIAAENITISAKGKREPAIPTRDGVAEPRNRRAEVFVR